MTTVPDGAEVTRRLFPPLMPRRPAADPAPQPYHPRTIGIVDRPLETAEIPLLAQLAAYDRAQRRAGRHRRQAAGLPGGESWPLLALGGGSFLAGASAAWMALILMGGAW